MFENLSSEEKARDWLQHGLEEVYYSYAIPHYHPDFFDQDNIVCVDAGANIGAFVVKAIASQRFNRVCAFEPFSQNVALMEKMLEVNNMADITGKTQVEIYQNAVYKENKNDVPLHAYSFECSGDIYLCEESNPEKDTGETCHAFTLDTTMELLQVDRINYLKMDVEGAEHGIFKNFTEFDKIDVIALETHYDKTETIHLLNEHFVFVNIYECYRDERTLSDEEIINPVTNLKYLTHPDVNNFLCFNRNSKGLTFHDVT
jgi:FkbM family methyltransferase